MCVGAIFSANAAKTRQKCINSAIYLLGVLLMPQCERALKVPTASKTELYIPLPSGILTSFACWVGLKVILHICIIVPVSWLWYLILLIFHGLLLYLFELCHMGELIPPEDWESIAKKSNGSGSCWQVFSGRSFIIIDVDLNHWTMYMMMDIHCGSFFFK